MPRKLNSRELAARHAALDEAAEHLLMSWTDSNVEWEQGKIISRWLKAEAQKMLSRSEAVRVEERNEK